MNARDFRIEEAARLAGQHHDGNKGFANAERRNIYQCQADPSHLIVTVDLEPGVTPFTIQCPICEGLGAGAPKAPKSFYKYPTMQSAMYVAHPSLVPTYEWYRPDSLEGLSSWSSEHVLKGGLLLRKRGAA